MKRIKVKKDQTLLDVALEHAGSAEMIGELLALNPGMSNDGAALQFACRAPGSFYPDLPISEGQELLVDDESSRYQPAVVRKMERSVTTYMSKEWQEQS